MNCLFFFRGIPAEKLFRHSLFFVLTFLSVFLTGYYMGDPSYGPLWLQGISYAVPLMVILGSHEMGHYCQARRYGIDVTLPFFIPLPVISPFGTLGAYIQMKSAPESRRALFDVAFWGPAMSFILSVPVTIWGLALSQVHPVPEDYSGYVFGDSLLFRFLVNLFFTIPEGSDVFIHPMAFAGWAGLFVTAINLLPVGQLDGGHISYAALGENSKFVAGLTMAVMVVVAYFYPGWLFWVLLLFFLGVRHPRQSSPLYMIPLDRGRKVMAVLSALVFVLTFIPFPLQVKQPAENPGVEVQPEQEKKNYDDFTNMIRFDV